MTNPNLTSNKLADMVSVLLSDVAEVSRERIALECTRIGVAFMCSISVMSDATDEVSKRRMVG